jgi:hypothetical protein
MSFGLLYTELYSLRTYSPTERRSPILICLWKDEFTSCQTTQNKNSPR